MGIIKRTSLPFVIISFTLIIIFFTLNNQKSFEPPLLLPILNTVFLGLIPFIVAFFAAKAYLETDLTSTLLMCCGMLVFGLGSTVAGWLRDIPNGANFTITIHNICAFVGALFHLSAAMCTETEKKHSRRFKMTRFTLCIFGVCVFTALLPVAISLNWMPHFFDQNGFSMLRQIVLWFSIAFYLSASMLFAKMCQRRKSNYFYWYSISLALITVGLFAVCVQPSVGSPIGWMGRIDQYIGCVFALLTIITAIKSARSEKTGFSSVIADFFADAHSVYQRVVETSTDAIISIDQNFNILYMNPAAERMYAIPYSKAVKTPFLNFVCDHDKSVLSDDFETFTATGKSVLASKTIELVSKDGNGRIFPIGVSTAMHLLPTGCVATYIIRDISDIKKTEEALRDSENMLRTILDNSRDGINMLDLASGKYVFMSPAQVELTGFTKDEINGITAEEAYVRVHPEDREISIEQQKHVAAGKDMFEDVEYRWRVKSGEYRWFSDKRKIVRNEQGHPVALVGISRDITDKKSIELELKKHTDDLNQKNKLLELSSEAIFAWNLNGFITYWNLGAQSLYGYSEEEAVGQKSHMLLKTAFPFVNDSIETILERDGYWKGELIHTKKDGQKINVETSQQVIVLGDNDLKIVIETNRDITEKKKLEETLRQNELLLNTIVQSTSDLLFINDSEGRVVFVNDAYKKTFGINSKDVIGKNTLELYHDKEVAGIIEENDRKVKQTGEAIVTEEIAQTTDGILSTFLVTKSPWRDGDGNIVGVVGVSHNITERKKTEEAMQRLLSDIADERERLQSIVESIDDEVWISDAAGNVTQLNHAAQCVHGLKADGTPVIEIVESLEILEPDGTPRLKENTPVLRGLKGETIRGEEIVRHLHTGELRYRRYSTAPIWDRLGNIAGTVTIAKDITDAKQAEQHAIEVMRESEARALALVKELEEADKNKNQFISVLSHELRNPLAAIAAGVQILDLSQETSQIVKAREIMKRQTVQLCKLVDDLLELTRITQNKIKLKKENINLNEIVKSTVNDIRPEYEKKGVKLATRIQTSTIFLNADPVRITQIIGNILFNALKFTHSNGEVWLTLKADKSNAEIIIEDNGIGISAEMLPHIFKPFTQAENTLARSNGGLGLGLSIVKGIVDLHEGNVRVLSSGLGKGSVFLISLPITTGHKPMEERQTRNTISNIFNILIIEDNRDFAELLSSMFEFNGHKVLIAFDGTEGIEKAKQQIPDVIFCDIGLPGINGFEVAKKIREEDSLKNIYLVALTGYAGNFDTELAKKSGFDRHIAKPVGMATLEKVLMDINC